MFFNEGAIADVFHRVCQREAVHEENDQEHHHLCQNGEPFCAAFILVEERLGSNRLIHRIRLPGFKFE